MKKNKAVMLVARGFAVLLSLGIIVLYFTGCTENGTGTSGVPSNRAMVITTTSMPSGAVTADNAGAKSFQVMDADHDAHSVADSVVVTRTRIVLSDLKLHRMGDVDSLDADDTVKDRGNDHDVDKDKDRRGHGSDDEEGEGTIKVGPFIAEFDSSGEKIVSEVTIPPGTYDRIKFEIHKLNENKDTSLLNDPLFGDFVNGGRYTVIIEGWAYVGGKAYAFTYKSSLMANVVVAIDSGAVFDSTKTYNLTLVFDPKIAFGRPGQKPFDPRDPDNHHAIDELIKRAIRALRIPR